jgi:ArsR family transcriptional regulator, arsenate/arsenite/antimonite-responsive transcriptional repressor
MSAMKFTEAEFREMARVLADPTRFAILSRIAQAGELACADLTQALEITAPTISHHIKELSGVELVEGRKEGKFYFYRLNAARWQGYLKELARRVPVPEKA